MSQQRLQIAMESAIFAVLAYLIGLIPLSIGPSFSIQVGAVAILILAFRRGAKAAMVASFLWGIISVLMGTASILTPVQAFLEYVVAFFLIGIAGFWHQQVKNQLSENKQARAFISFALATFVAFFCQYFIHFIAGIYFWGQFAPEGTSPVIYSLVMNTISGLATWVVAGLITWMLIKASPRLINVKK